MKGIGARIAGTVIAVTLVTVVLGVALQMGALLRERSQLPAPYRPRTVLMWPFRPEHAPGLGARGGMMRMSFPVAGDQPTVPEVRALLTTMAARRGLAKMKSSTSEPSYTRSNSTRPSMASAAK